MTGKSRVVPVCRHCGSDNVTCDALAEWDPIAQAWSIIAELDNDDCHKCGISGNVLEWKKC